MRFLVIDEADRLLDQSYHGWLGKVLKAAYNKQSTTNGFIKTDGYILYFIMGQAECERFATQAL